jgi:hypothetical protein
MFVGGELLPPSIVLWVTAVSIGQIAVSMTVRRGRNERFSKFTLENATGEGRFP